MREIKFRAWDIDKQKYITWFEIGCEGCVTTQEPNCSPDYPNVILEQYTGLKDKNGKKIYEGDIVEYMTCYYGNEKRHRKVVEWGEWYSDDFGEPHNLGYFNLSECMEVIGNIHENKELLKEKKEC